MGDRDEEGGMTEPVYIYGERTVNNVPGPDPADAIRAQAELEAARSTRRNQAGFLIFLSIIFLGAFAPLVVFLVRLALGN